MLALTIAVPALLFLLVIAGWPYGDSAYDGGDEIPYSDGGV